MSTTVSVVSLVGHAEAKLPRMLAFIGPDEHGKYPFDEYIFLVDSNSKDKTEDLVREFTDRARKSGVIAGYELHGFDGNFSVAWNTLFAHVRSEWHVHLASDEALLRADMLREKLALLPQDVTAASILFRETKLQRPWNRLTRILRTSAKHRYVGATHAQLVTPSQEIVRSIPIEGPILEHDKSEHEWLDSRRNYFVAAEREVLSGIEPRGFNLWMLASAALECREQGKAFEALNCALRLLPEKPEPWIMPCKRLHERLRRIRAGEPPFLGLAVLVKDSADVVDDLLRSVLMPSLGPAFDEYVFVDTGSRDGTVEHLNRWRHFADDYCVRFDVIEAGDAFVESGHFNFAAARNFAFEKSTAEWRMWLDSDDRLLGSDFLWSLLRNEPEEVNCVSLKYDYTGEGDGGSVWQDAKRIFRYPSGAVLWRGLIHEQPTSVNQHRVDSVDTPLEIGPPWGMKLPFHVVHAHANHERSMERNQVSLRHIYDTNNDPAEKARAAYFLGHAYARQGKPECKKLLGESLIGNAGNYLGILSSVALAEYLLETECNPDGAIAVLGAAHAICPELPEPLWVLGLAHKAKGDLPRAARFFYQASTLPDPPFRPHRNKLVDEHLGPMWTVETLRQCGQYKEALEILDKRLAGHKDDRIRLLGNRLSHDRYVRDVVEWVQKGAFLLYLSSEGAAVDRMIESLPEWWIEQIPQLRALQKSAANKVAHLDDPELYESRYAEAFKDTSLTPDQLGRISDIDRVVWMKGYIHDGMSVLAIGPHGGFFEAEILRTLPNVRMVMVEASEFGRDELLAKWKPEFGDRLEVISTLDSGHWPEGPFDVVEAFEVIEHVPGTVTFLDDMRARLKPDGTLLMSTPDVECWTPDLPAPNAKWLGHVRGYTPAIFHQDLMDAGLIVRRMVRSSEKLLLAACEKGDIPRESTCNPSVDILAPGYVAFDAEAHERQIVGGSEEAIIHLAPRLAKLGSTVTVYTNTGDHDLFSPTPRSDLLVKDNVRWEPIERFSPDADRDALILWRNSTILEQPGFKDAKGAKIVWLHDAVMDSPTALTKADTVMCVSGTHERFMRKEAGKYEGEINWRHIQNGVDPASFPEPNEEERDPRRAIYMSSPDRGLELLLDMWPEILLGQPKASLHIYYGFGTAQRMARSMDPTVAQHFRDMKDRVLKKMGELKNVVWHDGVAHPELHDALRHSGVWLYPHKPSNVETSCITAMKVLASGVWPVTTDSGALLETCFAGSFTEASLLEKPEGRRQFIQRAILALNGKAYDENGDPIQINAACRKLLREEAIRKFDWDIATRQVAEIVDDACGN
jgi:glycosyltransferase involved in cell wall biosynthesis/2-polyprenyl-3-methyl-5-hydroxy-6-metoxy-1,4-benzoquinol methylase/tetratricopeptide (TPR) repeat protein